MRSISSRFVCIAPYISSLHRIEAVVMVDMIPLAMSGKGAAFCRSHTGPLQSFLVKIIVLREEIVLLFAGSRPGEGLL